MSAEPLRDDGAALVPRDGEPGALTSDAAPFPLTRLGRASKSRDWRRALFALLGGSAMAAGFWVGGPAVLAGAVAWGAIFLGDCPMRCDVDTEAGLLEVRVVGFGWRVPLSRIHRVEETKRGVTIAYRDPRNAERKLSFRPNDRDRFLDELAAAATVHRARWLDAEEQG